MRLHLEIDVRGDETIGSVDAVAEVLVDQAGHYLRTGFVPFEARVLVDLWGRPIGRLWTSEADVWR